MMKPHEVQFERTRLLVLARIGWLVAVTSIMACALIVLEGVRQDAIHELLMWPHMVFCALLVCFVGRFPAKDDCSRVFSHPPESPSDWPSPH